MSKMETYPWSTLEKVGDHFFVEEKTQTQQYMSALVSQRNYHHQGTRRYAVGRVTGGTVVFLAQVEDYAPQGLVETRPGIWAMKARVSVETKSARGLGDSLSQEDRVKLMPLNERLENLPWWWDKNKAVVNARVMTREDSKRYITGGETIPGPNVPYPEYYRLDEDLRREKDEWDFDDAGEVSEEDSGPVEFEGEFGLPDDDEDVQEEFVDEGR